MRTLGCNFIIFSHSVQEAKDNILTAISYDTFVIVVMKTNKKIYVVHMTCLLFNHRAVDATVRWVPTCV